MVLRRARALANLLDNKTLYILPHERIVGNVTAKPSAVITYPELWWRWLDRAIERSGVTVQVLVETTAGQGTGLGTRFTELAYILDNSKFPELLGVCVDTCHIFAAGYELRTANGYEATVAALLSSVGLDNIRFFHLNDSKKELGSRVDRHEHIGKGAIGFGGFKILLNDKRFAGLPMTLETPKSNTLAEDRENLQVLRSLL